MLIYNKTKKLNRLIIFLFIVILFIPKGQLNMKKQIKIKIYPTGKIESETIGIKGKACLGYIKEIEQLTGANAVNSNFTNEYYEQETENKINNEVNQKSEYPN